MNSLEIKRNNAREQTRDLQPDLLHNLFFSTARKFSEEDFIYFNDRYWKYNETRKVVQKLSAGMHKLGIETKEKASIIFPNYPELIISKLSASLLGLIAVPLNYRLGAHEFEYLIRQSDSSYIITIDKWRNSDYIAMLKQICPEIFEGKTSSKFPNLKKIIIYSPEGNKYEGTYDFYDLIDAVNEEEAQDLTDTFLASKEIALTDSSDIMYTSGTTALPKGVLVSHDMMWRAALGSCLNRGYEQGRRIYVPIPLYHCYGYIVGLVGAVMVGGCIILQEDFEENDAIHIIKKSKADDILCVPTIAIRLLRAAKSTNAKLELNAMYCAGAEVPITLWQELKDELNIQELITGYGMTELAGGVMQTDPYDDISFLTRYVGKIIPGGHVGLPELQGHNIEFRIRDIVSREFLPKGSEGELVCRGPLVTEGYYKKEKETTEAIEDGWLNTGDLAIIHDNGYVTLTGRIKEIYRIGAENVAPKEIEDALTSHGKVNQAYVVGVPDAVLGEVGMAYVVLEHDQQMTEQELLQFISTRLARFKIPKYIQFLEEHELPRTATGKIQKFKLKEHFTEVKNNVKNLV